ncbi:hypothetical protein LPJ66_005474 [Kickxella alabastrina]|uniref:Uncharacterized protein n=1 Tax=Kickxella alabastrina TaxID=61397 RepID=A0ACC1II84_9FUNG|nr:hypothetical protein LPJ66_005474 [Kickxella alabastrina]
MVSAQLVPDNNMAVFDDITIAPTSCRRHRRNSDAFLEKASKHACLDEQGNSDIDNTSSCDEDSILSSNSRSSSSERLVTPSSHRRSHHYPTLSQSSDILMHRTFANLEFTLDPQYPPSVLCRMKSMHNNSSTAAAGRALRETIRGNTREEPMSSVKALGLFNTVFQTAHQYQGFEGESIKISEEGEDHDPSCKLCVSEAMVVAHMAVAEGMGHGIGRGGLRMNLGAGRNAVYVAPCERHFECPLDRKGKYLIHTNRPKIMTDLSKIEFGICVDGWRRVAFKTVNDAALAQRELSLHERLRNGSSGGHLVRMLDAFTDNSGKHVMVFPRMCAVQLFGRSLGETAMLARQVFVALEELHALGIAHMDVTPTNLMSDSKDTTHIEVIDLGLACDLMAEGSLPSRGTCGFVAPEVLVGGATDLRADVYSAGVVLGMMLQRLLPTVALRLLGGPLVRSDTTDSLVVQLDELLDAYGYVPPPADYIECNTPCVRTRQQQHRSQSRSGRQNRCSRGYSDDEAAAFAAAFAGPTAYSGYGYGSSDDDEDDGASGGGSCGSAHQLPGFPGISSRSTERYAEHALEHCVRRPGRVPVSVLHAADLLRWTLQPEAHCRPTAAQALGHPFLAAVCAPRTFLSSSSQSRRNTALPVHVDSGYLSGLTREQSPSRQVRGYSVAAAARMRSSYLGGSVPPVATPIVAMSPSRSPSRSPQQLEPMNSSLEPICLDLESIAALPFFNDTALGDVAAWESEMYARLAPATHCDSRRMNVDPTPGARSGGYGPYVFADAAHNSAGGGCSDDDDNDYLASFYAPSSYSDLSSYYY